MRFHSEPVNPSEAAERAMGSDVLESLFNKLTFMTAAFLQANKSNHRPSTKRNICLLFSYLAGAMLNEHEMKPVY